MATFLASKVPGEVVQRRWSVPVDSDDGVESASLSASGVTVDADSFEGNELVLTLSAGAAAATGSVVATVTTSRGRVLVETLYIPIIATASQIADTARDYCGFAMSKIVGTSNDPDAGELDIALERLNAIVPEWRAGGADIGCAFPISANTVIYCPDWAASALRFNLRLSCHDHFDVPLTQYDAGRAMRGLQLIKHKNLPADRGAETYY